MPARALVAVVALGLAVRLWAAAHVGVIAADGMVRVGIARSFAEQGWSAGLGASLERNFPPFNPILVAIAGGLTGDLERGGEAVSILFGTLGVAALGLLAAEAFGEREALVAAMLWALLPGAVHQGADVLTETQFLAFWVLAAWAGLRAARRGSAGWAILAGALGGLAYETRTEGLGIPAFFVPALAWLAIRERSARRLVQASALAAGFLLLAAPYLVHLRLEKGQWSVSPQKTLQNTVLPRTSPVPSGLPPTPPVPWGKYLRFAASGMQAGQYLLPVLAVAGLAMRRPWPPGGRLLLGLAALHGLVLLRLLQTAGYASERHFMPIAAVAAAWSAAAVAGLAARAPRAVWTGLALACAAFAADACRPIRADKVYRKEFGRWLAPHVAPGCRIATAGKGVIPYYAGRAALDWSANFPKRLEDMHEEDLPLFVVLERGEPGVPVDDPCIPFVQRHPRFEPVPLPPEWSGRFMLWRARPWKEAP